MRDTTLDSHARRDELFSRVERLVTRGGNREVRGRKVILPIWHGVTGRDVLKYSAPLADKVALRAGTMTIQEIARTLGRELGSR